MRLEQIKKHLYSCHGINEKITVIEEIPSMNELYSLTTLSGQQYIIKLCEEEDLPYSSLNSIVSQLAHLALSGANVSYPIQGANSHYIQQLDNKLSVLYNYACGKQYSNLTPEQGYRFGKECARIHSLSKLVESEEVSVKKIEQLLAKPLNLLNIQARKERSQELLLLNKLAKRSSEVLSQLADFYPYQSLCHGDFHCGNVSFTDQSLTIFDFDFCCETWRIYDPVVFLWNLIFSAEEDYLDVWYAFLNGYQSETELTPEEINAIPWLLVAHNIWHMGFIGNTPVEKWDFEAHWFDRKFALFEKIQMIFPDYDLGIY